MNREKIKINIRYALSHLEIGVRRFLDADHICDDSPDVLIRRLDRLELEN